MLVTTPQLSVVLGEPVFAGKILALQFKILFGGQTNEGGVLSTTTIVLLQLDVFPQSSVATHVRVRLYDCEQLPGMVTVVEVTSTDTSQPSVAVGVPKFGV